MTVSSDEARAYLERLSDLLPAREASRVCAEVESLILDRVEAEREQAGLQAPQQTLEAERRALAHLGSVEALADRLVNAPVSIGASLRRSFLRWLLVLIAGHLLLSLLLTVARSEGAALPGLLFPLPRHPWWATLTSALGVVLIDTGLLFTLFAVLGLRGREARLPFPALGTTWTTAQALRGLLLLSLVALLVHPLRDRVFAVRHGDRLLPFLAPDLVALLPWLDAVLAVSALHLALVVAGRGRSPWAAVADAAAGLLSIGLLVAASTRSEIVRLPSDALGAESAQVLGNLITRAFLVVFVGAALLLCMRVVKRLLRAWRLLVGA